MNIASRIPYYLRMNSFISDIHTIDISWQGMPDV